MALDCTRLTFHPLKRMHISLILWFRFVVDSLSIVRAFLLQFYDCKKSKIEWMDNRVCLVYTAVWIAQWIAAHSIAWLLFVAVIDFVVLIFFLSLSNRSTFVVCTWFSIPLGIHTIVVWTLFLYPFILSAASMTTTKHDNKMQHRYRHKHPQRTNLSGNSVHLLSHSFTFNINIIFRFICFRFKCKCNPIRWRSRSKSQSFC